MDLRSGSYQYGQWMDFVLEWTRTLKINLDFFSNLDNINKLQLTHPVMNYQLFI